MNNTDNLNKINQLGNTSIITYNDVQTRALDSVRVGKYCGKNLQKNNNVFIGERAGFNALNVENSVFIGYNAGENIYNGFKNIIIGHNINNDINNSISIGDNYTSTNSASIGNFNYNFGENNVIVGNNNCNFGNNFLSIGNNNINKAANIFFHNGFKNSNLTNIFFNESYNFFYDSYNNLYTNEINSKINFITINSNITFARKNIITDFIYDKLKKNCLIIQGICNILYNNSQIIDTTSNILLQPNDIYNLKNYSSSVNIPNSIIKRVSRPRLTNTQTIFFNLDGYILEDEKIYKIKYEITTEPLYGVFLNNIVEKLEFNSNNLFYSENSSIYNETDTYGVTPFLIINDNEFIKGYESFYTFQRTYKNDLNLIANPKEIILYSKDILFKSNNIYIDIIAFDFIYLRDYIINNLDNITEDEYSKVFVNFFEKPLSGFISYDNYNPTASISLNNLNNIIYQNYKNDLDIDTFNVNFSYGFYYANNIDNNLTININIINSNNIIFKDIYLFDDDEVKTNIIYCKYPTYIIDYSVSSSIIKIEDYYNFFKIKKNLDLNSDSLKFKLLTTLNENLLFDNENFYSWFGNINVKFYNNKYICNNKLLISNKESYNYQFLRYNFDYQFFAQKTKISFDVMPFVIFNTTNINNIYNFNLSFYDNDILQKTINYNNTTNINKLDFNIYTNIIYVFEPQINLNINNVRLEYYIDLNIINNPPDFINYITELYFKNIIISSYLNANEVFSVSMGKNINIEGNNNIAIGSNIYIVGENSVVIGNNENKNPINESIVIGKNNFKNDFANNSIIIGNNNTSIINNRQLIIGNNINNNFLFNIDNTICRNEKAIYLGLDGTPVAIGYNSNELPDISDKNSLYVKDGIYIPNITLKNNSNYTITLKADESLDKNITYTIPKIPENFSKLMLTTNSNGIMAWDETDTLNTSTSINVTNIICSNIDIKGIISGDGSRLINVNISDKTTDDLIEGNSNLYFTNERASNVFATSIKLIDSDKISEGNSNLFFTYERNTTAFFLNLSNLTCDNIKEGSNNLYYNEILLSNTLKTLFSNYTTNDLNEGNSNLFFTNQRFLDKFNEIIITKSTDYFTEGNSNLFFTEDKATNKLNNFINLISSDNIKEGNSNTYFNINKLQSNINNLFNLKTSDDIIEGKSNIYYNEVNISNIIENIIITKTTDNIPEGNCNLYFTTKRFNDLLKTKTTDNVIEGKSNLYFTQNNLISFLSNINTDFISEGKFNLYYKDIYAKNFFYNNLSNFNTDDLIQGNTNKFIINNTYNNDLNVSGNISANNIFINNCNILDIYSNSIINAQSNYAKSYTKYTTASNVIINNSNQALKMTLNIYPDNNLIINNSGPPIIVVGSNVGFNTYTPKYNIDVNGITNSTYFKGDGSMLRNINLDYILQGLSNKFIQNNIYNNSLTVDGNIIYNESTIKGDIIPFIDNKYNIGTTNSYLKNIYTKKISFNNTCIFENDCNICFSNIFNSSFCGIKINNIKLQDNFSNSSCAIELSNNKLNFILNGTNNPSNLINYNLLYNLPILNYTENDVGTTKNVFFKNIDISDNLTISNINLFNIFITSNVLSNQSFINSNSVKNILLPFITSNVLSNQSFINSNSVANILLPFITSNVLSNQSFINSNSVANILLPFITSNVLSNQSFINSNSVANILTSFITSNVLSNQSFINSNSVANIILPFITSNVLSNQSFINSNSVANILTPYITSNVLSNQSFINSNSVANILLPFITSNVLSNQSFINSNSFYNIGYNLNFITSNSILHILQGNFTTNTSNNSNITNDLITSNVLFQQNYINSNTINNILIPYFTSNSINQQGFISSNNFNVLINPYFTSNAINQQAFISSNNINNIINNNLSTSLLPYVTLSYLAQRLYINSNVLTSVLTPYISSNNLTIQNYINSNSITNILIPYVNSNTLQNYVTSNSISHILSGDFGNKYTNNVYGLNTTLIDFDSYTSYNVYSVSSINYVDTHSFTYKKHFGDSELLIQVDFPYLISGFGTDTFSSRLKISSSSFNSAIEYSQEHIQVFIGYAAGGGTRSTTLSPINHKTSMEGQQITITLQLRQYDTDTDDVIQTNSCLFVITEKKPTAKLLFSSYVLEEDIPKLTSNIYISSNQITNILIPYFTSNSLSNQRFINSNSIDNILSSYISSNNLKEQQYISSNEVRGIITNNIIGYNSTLIDFNSFNSYTTYTVSSTTYTNTHTCTYTKFFSDSEILIQADFPYTISGHGTDVFSSRIQIKSDVLGVATEYSQEHIQSFIGYAAGGGTRSTTLSPLNYKSAIEGTNITITVQLRQLDSDDSIITPSCLFIITEKKPSSKLIFSSYINETDIPRLTSNTYISSNQLTNILLSYQTNLNGKWNKLNNNIFYNDGNVGIGQNMNNPVEKLHVLGNIVASGNITSSFSDIRLKSITSNIINATDLIDNLQGFKYKNNDLAKSLGFTSQDEFIGISAQDVKKIMPQIVSLAPFDIDKDENGDNISKSGNNYLTVQYDKLIPVLIEAIKELKKENKKLKNRIELIENNLF